MQSNEFDQSPAIPETAGAPESASGASAAIAEFWDWWLASGSTKCGSAIADRDPERIAGELATHVHRIDPGLVWELGAGTDSVHVLTVTAAGDGDLRATARRWLRAAPPADPIWSYADLRPPAPEAAGGVLQYGEATVSYADVVAGVRAVGNHLDVTLHHPAFADLDEESRDQIVYLVLDAVVGELAVESWLGEISATTVEPLDAFPVVHLRRLVEDFARDRTDTDGRPHWVALQGNGPDGPVLALTIVPLSPVIAPHLDTHVAVDLPYADRTAEGLPTEVSLAALRAMEEHLGERLGPAGQLVAAETTGGLRRLHYYVDADGPGAGLLAAAVTGWDQGAAETTATHDPGWGDVAHLRS